MYYIFFSIIRDTEILIQEKRGVCHIPDPEYGRISSTFTHIIIRR